ncbi:MAG: hypothetical protein AB1428_11260 [Bacteroidota bacterium]
MRILISSVVVLLLVSAVAVQGAVIKGTPTAYSNGSTIVVRWQSEDETGVIGYEIARKSGASDVFMVLAPSLQAKGNNASYEFTDESAFRITDSYYQYRITALYSGGGRSDPYYVVVTHSVSSVRRTWGSIKAMFR